MKVHFDFETKSADDLKQNGLFHYVKHPTTDFQCMAFAVDNHPVELWKVGEQFPIDLLFHLKDGGEFYAHNAQFEFQMWNEVGVKKYGWPKLPISQINCTMATAYAMGLPGALEKLAPALGIEQQKDMKGNRVMLQLSRPRGIEEGACPDCKKKGKSPKGCVRCNGTGDNWFWWEKEHVPEKYETLYEYCIQDVEVERAACDRMLSLSKPERKLWLIDHTINERGVQVDIPAIEVAMEIVELEKKRLDKEMRDVTDNAVATSNAATQIKDFLSLKGVDVSSVVKADVLKLLELSTLPADCRRVLEIRQEGAKSSNSKLKAMARRANTDGRVRGIHQYHAATTGRWGGRGVNFQNIPRPNLEQEEIEKILDNITKHKIKDVIANIDMFYGQPTDVISNCLRGFIRSKAGHDLIGMDFAAIEARVLAWLAGEESVLEVFRTHGKIYEAEAAKIFRKSLLDVDKSERQIGKVAILSLGFGGGVGAFQAMAKNYNVKVSDARANEIKLAYRKSNQKIVKYWYALEEAATLAIQNPGKQFKAGALGRQITYLMNGSFLWCRLPSGRAICYPYARVEMVDSPIGPKLGITYMTEDSLTHKWVRSSAWYGVLAENVTQAVARDLLAEAIIRLEENNYPVVMHVHDEVVLEVLESFGSLEEVEALIKVIPSWAKDLPIAAEGWRGKRYRK